MCANRTITGLTVEFVKGNSNFGGYLNGLTALSGFKVCKAILLVVDIDESLADSFKYIREQLMAVGFPTPTSQLQIANKQGFPSLAVLMIPHPIPASDARGALETLLGTAMDSLNPNKSACVKTMLDCAGVNTWGKKSSRDKAFVRSLIASVNENDPMIGLPYCFGRKATLVPLGHACFDEVALVLRHFAAWSASTHREWSNWRVANSI